MTTKDGKASAAHQCIETMGEVRTKFADHIRVEVRRFKSAQPAHVERIYVVEDSRRSLLIHVETRVKYPIYWGSSYCGGIDRKDDYRSFSLKGSRRARFQSDEVLIFGLEHCKRRCHDVVEADRYGMDIALFWASPIGTRRIDFWEEKHDDDAE